MLPTLYLCFVSLKCYCAIINDIYSLGDSDVKKFLTVFSLLLLTTVISVLQSYSASVDEDSIYSMAQYFPTDTNIFTVTRFDDEFIDEVDTLYSIISTVLADNNIYIPPDLTDLLSSTVTGLEQEVIQDWLGEYIAIGQTEEAELYIVFLLDDRESFEAYLSQFYPEDAPAQFGSTVLYAADGFVVEFDGSVMRAMVGDLLPDLDDGTLQDTSNFQNIISALPLEEYAVGMYFNAQRLLTEQVPIDQLEIVNPNIGSVAIGLTSIDEKTMVADVVHVPVESTSYNGSGRISSSFMSNIPDNMANVAVASDLSHLISTSLDELYAIDERSGGMLQMPNVNEEIFSQLGIDLEDDVLSWLIGGYAMFANIDVIPIIKDSLAYELNVNGRINLGVIADAGADPIASARLVNRLDLILQSIARSSELSYRNEVIAGVDVSVIVFDVEIRNPFVRQPCGPSEVTSDISIEFVLGSNNDLFVFATRPLAEMILRGEYQSIDATESYMQAQEYFLPDPTSIWYSTGSGILQNAIVLNPDTSNILVGPAIGCIFEDIVAELNTSLDGTPTVTPTPLPTATPDFQQIDRQVEPLEDIVNLIDSASITSTVTDDGIIMARFAITYNP